ncbi:MAG: Arsenate-mycothiol transferase ArsC1 [Pelotomaculum sp. PtaB.Bin013]|nr:MAG: Arsenate-mycothiol transferase ArsC1 [Pelotomaculum sp. PtaB.Bin013]
MKKKVLFICTHNSARSQMAEGLLRHLFGEYYETYSAGTAPSRVSPQAIEVMKEIDIDITKQHSKSINEFYDAGIDCVVTVCDRAREACPVFPEAKELLHKGFEDPSASKGSEEEIVAAYRRVRDEIQNWIKDTFIQP